METASFTWLSRIATGEWEHVLTSAFVASLLVAFAFVVRRRLADPEAAVAPDDGLTVRSAAEAFVEAMLGLVRGAIPDAPERYVPLLASFFAFILVGNVIGLVPGFVPPTSSFNVTFALGLVSFGAYHAYGVKTHGVVGYLAHFLGPVPIIAPLMLIIELFSHAFRPVSLGVRLYANMFADHEVIAIFTGLTYVLVPVAFYALGFFVSIVQAFVFTILSAVYIAGGQAHEEDDDEDYDGANE